MTLPWYTTLFPGICTGLLLTAAFPDAGLYPLAFVALCPLVISLKNSSPRQCLVAGMAAGMAHYLTLIYWIVPTLCTFGNLHFLLSAATLILLCLYLSLYVGVFAAGLKQLSPAPLWMPLTGAALWTALEQIRTVLLTGFPWGALGYSQYANLPLVQMADLTGVTGISFVLVLCNLTLAQAFVWYRGRTMAVSARCGRDTMIALGIMAGVLSAVWGYAHWQMPRIERLMAEAPHPVVAVVQGNMPQDQKWDIAFRQATLEKYDRLTRMAVDRYHPDLVIWPETALPFYFGHHEDLTRQVIRQVQATATPLLTGSPAIETRGPDIRYFNRVCLISADGQVSGYHDKTHLVPFGEYVPFRNLLFFIETLTEQAGNFSPGTRDVSPLAFAADHRMGVMICFEILFPRTAARLVRKGADILTTVTNDAWFGHTSAPRQHFAIAVLRAVENRRSLARAANTGISGFIDPLGRIASPTSLFEDAVIARPLPALTGMPVYSRFPDLLPFVCLIAIAGAFVVKGRQLFTRRPVP